MHAHKLGVYSYTAALSTVRVSVLQVVCGRSCIKWHLVISSRLNEIQ
jgi:hypothetical protein